MTLKVEETASVTFERLKQALKTLPEPLAEKYLEQIEQIKELPPTTETVLLASQVFAKAGGDAILCILNRVRNGEDLGLEMKKVDGIVSPVTIADKNSNDIICAGIEYLFPTHGIYSEESVELHPYQKEYTWVIDPLDGTAEFVKAAKGKNITEFGVHVGLVKEGRAILGTTHFPALDTSVWASKGNGAFKQLGEGLPERIVISPSPDNLNIRFLMSRSAAVKEENEQFYRTLLDVINPDDEANFKKLFTKVIPDNGQEEIYPLGENRCIRIGSTGLKGCMVLYGPGNLFLAYGPQCDWDVASWAIAVQEAGGVVTDFYGNELIFNNKGPMPLGILAARTPELHARAIAALAQYPDAFIKSS